MQIVKNVATQWLELFAFVFFALLMALQAQAASPTPMLLLMDSRSKAAFGEALDEKLRKVPGAQLTTLGLCDSTPSDWMTGATSRCGYLRRTPTGEKESQISGSAPALNELLSQLRPGYTVVVTGEASLKDGRHRVQSDFRRMAQQIRAQGGKCLWVGPAFDPHSVHSVRYYSALRELSDEVECALADLPALHEMEVSFDLADFVVEMIKLGVSEPAE